MPVPATSSGPSSDPTRAVSARPRRAATCGVVVALLALAGGLFAAACQPAPSPAPAAQTPASESARAVDASKSARPTPATCDATWNAANEGFAAAASHAPRECKTKDDCVLVRAGCVGCGGVAIAKAGAARYESDVRRHAEACDDFFRGECAKLSPKPVPSCPAFEARCLAGKCEMRDVREK